MTRFIALALLAALLAPATLAQTCASDARSGVAAQGIAAQAEAAGLDAPEARSLARAVNRALAKADQTEDEILRASNAGANDLFGLSVSLSGDRALVGALAEAGPGNGAIEAGAAYVFEFAGGMWTETAILRASNAEAGDYFGRSVSLSGDRALVGATGEDGPTGGTSNSGAAYVFDLTGGAWTETAVLRASNAEAFDLFGISVSLSGDRALVGAHVEDGPTNGTSASGAAYVFDLAGSVWTETAVLRASNAEAVDQFGWLVSLSGDRALVGAPGEDGPGNSTVGSGAAYVFDLAGGVWTETALFRASNAEAGDVFGRSVSLSGDRALVGAHVEAGPTNGTSASGAAYVYDFDGTSWSETAILRASNAEAEDFFGVSVSLSGDRALVGAQGEDGPTGGTSQAGAAYVFDLAGGVWTETAILRASNAEAEDFFGVSVSLSGDRALVGAFGEDGPTNGTIDSGAAYTYTFGSSIPDVDIAYISSTAEPQRSDQVFIRARVTNNETITVRTRVYFEVLYPDGRTRRYSVLSKDLPAGASIQVQTVKQMKFPLAADAPAGAYTVTLYAAQDQASGGAVYDSASFTFDLGPIPGCAAACKTGDLASSPEAGPNPFTRETAIRYSLEADADVDLRVFDARGRAVATLASGVQSAGEHSAVFAAGDLPSGVYVWRLAVGGAVTTGRVTRVR